MYSVLAIKLFAISEVSTLSCFVTLSFPDKHSSVACLIAMQCGESLIGCAAPETSLEAVFMSAPLETQSMFNAESITNAATYMEMTVPLLHEAKPAGSHLLGQTEHQSSQVCCSGLQSCAADNISHITRRSGCIKLAEQGPTGDALALGTGLLCG